MPGREPIIATFICIDLALVRQGKVKELHAITHLEITGKKAQKLDAELMTKDSEMVELGLMRSKRWRQRLLCFAIGEFAEVHCSGRK